MDTAEESLRIYENLSSGLSDIYEMAVRKDDLLSEDFSIGLYSEIRNLNDRYGEQLFLAKGGMKQVFKVEDKTTGRFVAMAYPIGDGEQSKERFLREARLTATLEHPNIMPVYDIGIDFENKPFFTMKLTGDKNLQTILKERKNSDWPLVQRLNLFMSICEGISYAHSRHVIHLDIKPQNILVGEFGEVLVCDWGLGKILFDEEEEDEYIDPSFFNEMTLDGVVKGTPGYMAPEQINKKLGERDYRTDIYALGGILYALLAGDAPIKGDTVEDIFGKTTAGQIPPLRDLKDNKVPLALDAVAMKALAVEPELRYNSVQELINEIESFLSGFATSAENAGFFKNSYLLMKRHKTSAFFSCLIVVLSTIFVVQLQKSEKQARDILTLYEAEKKQTELISKDASPHLATQAMGALYSYDFDRSLEFADRAVIRDPQNKNAWSAKALIHFYRQEFTASTTAMNKAEVNPTTRYFKSILRSVKGLKNDDSRLTPDEFISVLHKIPTQTQKRIFFRNEVENYRSISKHMKIINEMLFVNNPHVKHIAFDFKNENGKNILNLAGNTDIEQVGCIRQMPLHKLNVEGLSLKNNETAQMRGMPLEELNVAGTNIDKFAFVDAIPNLKKLTITKGVASQEVLADLHSKMQVIEK